MLWENVSKRPTNFFIGLSKNIFLPTPLLQFKVCDDLCMQRPKKLADIVYAFIHEPCSPSVKLEKQTLDIKRVLTDRRNGKWFKLDAWLRHSFKGG